MSDVFNIIKNTFLYAGVEKDDYEKVKSDIIESNRSNLVLLTGIAATAISVMTVLSFFVPILESSRLSYIVCVIVSAMLFMLAKGPAKNKPMLTYIGTYVFSIMILGVGIALGTIIEPHQASVSFAVLMFAAPLFFADIPLRLNLMTVASIAVYLAFARATQDPEMYAFNESVMLPYGMLCVLLVTLQMKMRVSYFVKLNNESALKQDVTEKESYIAEITRLNKLAMEYNDAMANAGYGMWHIILKDGVASRMQVNEKMAELLGVAGKKLSEEEMYNAWYDQILPEAIPSVQTSVGEMITGNFSENTYQWVHPTKGVIYVRCGGTAVTLEDGTNVLSGYHADVTDIVNEEEQKKAKLERLNESLERQVNVIGGLSNAYFCCYSADLNTGEFIEEKQIEGIHEMLKDCHTIDEAFSRYISLGVVPENQELLTKFTDVRTLPERMTDTDVISLEYRGNITHRWNRASWIAAKRNENGRVYGVLYVVEDITDSVLEREKQEELVRASKQAQETSVLLVQTLSNTIEARNEYLRGHSLRVSKYSVLIAQKIGLSEEEIERIRKAATLHDLGKISVPDAILNKPSRLTDEEYQIIKNHCRVGSDMLKDISVISYTSDIVRHHHERYDGKGYPDGLKGEGISIGARIVAVADSFDAMNSKRVYRDPLDRETIRNEILNGRGSQFDPAIADAFMELYDSGIIDEVQM